MRVVFASIPAYGHLYPMLPLAQACADAGHDVVVATGDPFLERLALPTVRCFDHGLDLDAVVQETLRRHPGAEGLTLTVELFADTTAEQVSARLIRLLPEVGADLLVYEAMNAGAGVAAGALGIPAVAFSIGLGAFVPSMIHRAAVGHHARHWREHGRQPPADPPLLLADAVLDPAPPTLRLPVPDQAPTLRVLPIRSVPFSEDGAEVPDWLREPPTRPRIYLTLGTVSFGAVEVLRRTLDDIAELPVEVLVTVGPDGDPAAVGDVPDSVHLERFVAQSSVLPLVDLVVQHGGTGTVLGAVSHGLPQLLLPQGADQFANGRLLTERGVARTLTNDEQQPGAIRAAVLALLAPDAPERAVAAAVMDEIAAMPAPAEVVPALEALAAGRGVVRLDP